MDPVYRPGVIPLPPQLWEGWIQLRPWKDEDLPCIEEASRDPVIPRGTTVPSRFTPAAGHAFIERQWGRHTSGEGLSLAITEADTDTAIGLMTVLHRQQSGVVGVGYWTVASRRRAGAASTALTLLSRWALGLAAIVRLEGHVEPANHGSIRVLESAGFHREGRLRQYLDIGGSRRDVWLYSLITSDVSDTSHRPRPIT
ncbi:GNAT family N-acetyltransferase [Parafrankia discariae]|uniref:GNAT family N-acetyltransferase n=1 Tax=Parafrankia discariae TaxID=365528 RepID=UPI001E5F52F8|nr:GNAT family protein [Parafrankia discariae]